MIIFEWKQYNPLKTMMGMMAGNGSGGYSGMSAATANSGGGGSYGSTGTSSSNSSNSTNSSNSSNSNSSSGKGVTSANSSISNNNGATMGMPSSAQTSQNQTAANTGGGWLGGTATNAGFTKGTESGLSAAQQNAAQAAQEAARAGNVANANHAAMVRAGDAINAIQGADESGMSYNFGQVYDGYVADAKARGMTDDQAKNFAKTQVSLDATNQLAGPYTAASGLSAINNFGNAIATNTVANALGGMSNIAAQSKGYAAQAFGDLLAGMFLGGGGQAAKAGTNSNNVANVSYDRGADYNSRGMLDSQNKGLTTTTNNTTSSNNSTGLGTTASGPAASGFVANDGSGGRASAFSDNSSSSASNKGVVGSSSGVTNNGSSVDNGSLASGGSGSLKAPERNTDSIGFSKYNKDEANYDQDNWNRGMEQQSSGLVSDEACKHFAKRAFSDGPHFKKARTLIIERIS